MSCFEFLGNVPYIKYNWNNFRAHFNTNSIVSSFENLYSNEYQGRKKFHIFPKKIYDPTEITFWYEFFAYILEKNFCTVFRFSTPGGIDGFHFCAKKRNWNTCLTGKIVTREMFLSFLARFLFLLLFPRFFKSKSSISENILSQSVLLSHLTEFCESWKTTSYLTPVFLTIPILTFYWNANALEIHQVADTNYITFEDEIQFLSS